MDLVKRLILLIIRGYRATKGWRLQRCRFYPSCSQYAQLAISKHGLLRGGLLIGMRLIKCQPFHPGGVDEVPDQVFWGFNLSSKLKWITAQYGGVPLVRQHGHGWQTNRIYHHHHKDLT